ncbi:hypothetical protein NPIL_469911 [Nephila pilipes]|uniref:Uncharacterized protein n=1 Tax=Nephila pilipes TaxID=299642 RepID=A0A8X6TFV1_NEPPI|nr:hypothetical protein NPIL_469911 [Nephila pilipes]
MSSSLADGTFEIFGCLSPRSNESMGSYNQGPCSGAINVTAICIITNKSERKGNKACIYLQISMSKV